MADPQLTLDDYKRFALEQAQAGAPSINPAVAPLQGQPSSGPMLNPAGASDGNAPPSQSPMPQMQAPTPTGPDPNAPPTATVTNVQQHQGPIKSFLSQFLYGAGQAMTAHVGLQTDAQKQQVAFQQQQAQGASQRAQQLQSAQIQNYQSQSDQRDAQNQPVDTSTLGIPGLTGTVLQKDLPKVLVQHIQNQGRQQVGEEKNQANIDIANLKYGDGSKPGPLNTVIKEIGGRSVLLRKGTGEVLKDLGEANSITTATARAKAQAAYGLTNTMDEDGNPTSVSRLEALQNGLPSVGFDALKQVKSDLVGVGQYQDILEKQISPNLKVLNDPKQRAIIAATLSEAEKNPGAIKALLISGAQSGLSPEGAALTAGIMQGREFGGVARKYGGNMNGTEGLMNRIMANQASPLNSEQLNRDLIQNDTLFTQRAGKTISGLTSHRKGGGGHTAPTAAPASAPPAAPSGGSFFGQFGGSAKQP